MSPRLQHVSAGFSRVFLCWRKWLICCFSCTFFSGLRPHGGSNHQWCKQCIDFSIIGADCPSCIYRILDSQGTRVFCMGEVDQLPQLLIQHPLGQRNQGLDIVRFWWSGGRCRPSSCWKPIQQPRQWVEHKHQFGDLNCKSCDRARNQPFRHIVCKMATGSVMLLAILFKQRSRRIL